MAGLFAILRALARVLRRDLNSYGALKGNNFFLLIVLLLRQPESAGFFLLVVVILLVFPLSSDPLARIPPDRLALWPLSLRQRRILRIASLLLSPVLWIALVVLLAKGRWDAAALFLSAAIAARGLTALGDQTVKRAPRWNLLRRLPLVPGPLGGLILNHARQMLTTLDTYLAILISGASTAYRVCGGNPDPYAFPILSLVVALALSTCGQCLFGLDGSGIVRYRLLPLRGWQVLLAKDIAYLAILFLLVLPLAPLPGITAGLAGLAIGHHGSVWRGKPQKRWHFASGSIAVGILQIAIGTALGAAAHSEGLLYFALAVALFALSLFLYGRIWESGNG